MRLRTPMMAIHTVAAGGGSILHYRRRALPRRPGLRRRRSGTEELSPRRPADRHRRECDGRQAAGPICFPRSSGRDGDQPLDEDAVRERVRRTRARDRRRRARRRSRTASSASRSRTWPTRSARSRSPRAIDARDYALNCFGGAGGQHACLVADALGMTHGVHPSAVGPALGLRHEARGAAQRAAASCRHCRSTMRASPLRASWRRACEKRRARRARTRRARNACDSLTRLHIRYEGSDTTLAVPLASAAEMPKAFARDHARQFGFGFEGRALIVESMEVEAYSLPSSPA